MGRKLKAKKKVQLMAARDRLKLISHSTRGTMMLAVCIKRNHYFVTLAVLRVIDQNVPSMNINAPKVHSFILQEPTAYSAATGNNIN